MTISSSVLRVPRGALVRGAVAATAAVLLAGLISPALAGSPTTKPYSDTASPGSIGAGATVSGSFSITNLASPQSLGSAEITPPSGLTISSPTVQPSGTAYLSGGKLELRNLNLAAGATVTASFGLTAACGSIGGSWTSVVKQSNAFNGPPGNNFTISGSEPSTFVSGSCHLAFVNEPADATVSTVITSVAGDPTGPAVSVAALAGDGTPMAGVSISLAADPAASLGDGMGTTGPAGAAASFGGLEIATVGTYTLTATATGFAPATSVSFTIANAFCAPGADCEADVSSGNTDTNVKTNGGTSGGFITLVLSGGNLGDQCAGYQGISDLSTAEVTTDQGSTVVLTIKKALSGNRGVSSFQVCFSSDGTTFALLPDCASNQNPFASAPCVVSRNRSPQARSDVQITFVFPAGDPKFFS